MYRSFRDSNLEQTAERLEAIRRAQLVPHLVAAFVTLRARRDPQPPQRVLVVPKNRGGELPSMVLADEHNALSATSALCKTLRLNSAQVFARVFGLFDPDDPNKLWPTADGEGALFPVCGIIGREAATRSYGPSHPLAGAAWLEIPRASAALSLHPNQYTAAQHVEILGLTATLPGIQLD